MREADIAEFSRTLDAVCGLLSRGNYVPNATNTTMWFRSLAAHDITAVRAGFDAHVKDPQRGRFVPVPADILAQIAGQAADDGRPGAEEAWTTALRASDEAQTVLWTDETAMAWNAARPVFDGGDRVGARMAFKEVYGRLVDNARRLRTPVQWKASLGFDAAQRDIALKEAAKLNRLPAPERLALPAPEASLEALTAAAPADVRQRLLDLRNRLAGRQMGPSQGEIDRRRTEELKAASAAAVGAYLGTPA